MLIFDDTIQEKAWTDESELMCWHFDHCSGRTVRGINLLNALYYCNGTSIPVAFELVKKPIQYSDIATKKLKRKGEKTKNEMMREMIETCIGNALKFRFVLMDSWFSSEENFDFITGKGRHFIAALKDNRLIALSEEDRKKKRFVRVDELDFPEQTEDPDLHAAEALKSSKITHTLSRRPIFLLQGNSLCNVIFLTCLR